MTYPQPVDKSIFFSLIDTERIAPSLAALTLIAVTRQNLAIFRDVFASTPPGRMNASS
jgi:hypothetical protein